MVLDSASVDDTADGQPALAHSDCQPAVPNTLWRIVARLVPEYQITSIFPPQRRLPTQCRPPTAVQVARVAEWPSGKYPAYRAEHLWNGIRQSATIRY